MKRDQEEEMRKTDLWLVPKDVERLDVAADQLTICILCNARFNKGILRGLNMSKAMGDGRPGGRPNDMELTVDTGDSGRRDEGRPRM